MIDRLPRSAPRIRKDDSGAVRCPRRVVPSSRDYEACSFVKVLFEVGAEGRIGKACIGHLDKIRDVLRERAEEAGLRNANDLREPNILVKGSIVCAAEGDSELCPASEARRSFGSSRSTPSTNLKRRKGKARHDQRLIMRIAISGAGVAGAALASLAARHRP